MASVFVLLEAFNRKEAAALGFFPCATASLRVSTVPLSDSYNGLKRYWGTASLIGRVAVPATKLIPAEYDTAQYETNQNRTMTIMTMPCGHK